MANAVIAVNVVTSVVVITVAREMSAIIVALDHKIRVATIVQKHALLTATATKVNAEQEEAEILVETSNGMGIATLTADLAHSPR